MKTLLTSILLLLSVSLLQAQTAEEIIDTYIENTGGADEWASIDAVHKQGTVKEGDMIIPVNLYETKEGKWAVIIDLQGQIMPYAAFDGEDYWEMNMNTMVPEKADKETSNNMRLESNDFPSEIINYKANGYDVEFLGKETRDGTETYKIKLTTEPRMINGQETPSIKYYYFETENSVPIAVETVQGNGQVTVDNFSDYQEVDGLYFPFSYDIFSRKFSVDKIILNPEIKEEMFKMGETGK